LFGFHFFIIFNFGENVVVWSCNFINWD